MFEITTLNRQDLNPKVTEAKRQTQLLNQMMNTLARV